MGTCFYCQEDYGDCKCPDHPASPAPEWMGPLVRDTPEKALEDALIYGQGAWSGK